MPPIAHQHDQDLLALQQCVLGDTQGLTFLRDKYQPVLLNVLLARGASRTEADDLLADLWGDCVAESRDRPSLLEKFSGKCALQSWLITVVTNRLIDRKRRQSRQCQVVAQRGQEHSTDFFERIPAPVPASRESGLIEVLRDSLQQAFARCPAEGLLMLRLVYLYGLTQRELACMWGCHEATISRALAQTMAALEKNALQELKKRDPWLDLTWQDLVDLCETQQMGFL